MHTLLFRDPVQTALWVALPMAHTSQVESRLQTILDKTRNRRTLKRRFSLFAAAYGAIALVPVAMLRPAAQAQSRAAADLANGQAQETLSVQLVGITDATVRGGEWWNIGGKRLPGRPFNTGEWAVGTTTTVQPGQVGRFFAFRLPPAMQNVPVLYDFPDWTLGGLTILTPGRLTIKGSRPVETMRSIQIQSSSDLLIYGAAFPSSLSRTRIRVGRGSGIWQKRMIMKLRLGQIRRKAETIQMRPGQILHLSARNVDTLIPDITLSGKGYGPDVIQGMKDGISFSAFYDAHADVRMVAIDASGRQIMPTSMETAPAAHSKIVARFAKPLSQIKEVDVESRPFVWTEFQNVALQPFK